MKKSSSYLAYKKSPFRSIKHSTYFDVYDQLFCKYKNKKIIFVEIGILAGGSLFMWREFFGNKARIIGIDMNPEAKKWEKYGFEIFIGNQADERFWKRFIRNIGNVDIVLDDGGHTYEQQITTVEMLLEHIKDNGVLVVEDTHTSYMNGFGPKEFSFISYAKKIIDQVNKRFGFFIDNESEKRIWSVEFFESIVAFKVNKKATQNLSKPTDNKGKNDNAQDFRYADDLLIDRVEKFFKIFKFIPGSKILSKYLKFLLINRNFKAKKFFK